MVPMAAGCVQVAAILHCAALATPLPTHSDQLWRARLSGFPAGVDKRPFPWTGLGFRLLDHLRDNYFNLVPEDDIAVEPEDGGDYEPVSAVKREAGGEEQEQDQYQGVRGMWGKRGPKMREIRRWGKRRQQLDTVRNLRGMWGKRSALTSARNSWGKRSPSVLGGRARRFYIVWGAGGRPVTRPYNKYIHALTDWNLKQISRGESSL